MEVELISTLMASQFDSTHSAALNPTPGFTKNFFSFQYYSVKCSFMLHQFFFLIKIAEFYL